MLHEVLLALSGHPSPLFGDREADENLSDDADFPLLSPSEKALLESLGQLSRLHIRLKRHLEAISSSHASIICRATAISIQQTHLARFQQRILDVEAKILKRDATLVGAYEIVPLATVVGEFDDWHRRMSWYWQMACHMLPVQESSRNSPSLCTGSALIDRLRNESHTGFPDIAEASKELVRVAEGAWLRQLVSWVIYGKLPSHGVKDFFIQRLDPPHEQTFVKHQRLAPDFVTSLTGTSIHFIGRCLHQVERHRQAKAMSSITQVGLESSLATKHLQHLSTLSLPIAASHFSKAISDIRLSLSQNVLQHLLPMTATLEALSCFRQFFLLERGAFATALIKESENRIMSRQQSTGRSSQPDPIKAMQGLNIKDVDFAQALQQVWKTLAAEDMEDVDHVREYAQKNMRLTAPRKEQPSRLPTPSDSAADVPAISTVAFNDLLFPAPSELTFEVPSPLDLLLTTDEIATYTSISSYLLAIRRGHHRLSDLWRRTPARRDHPLSTMSEPEMRKRRRQQATETRKVWATCSAANFLLSEVSAFLEGEIIKGSHHHFITWVQTPAPAPGFQRSTSSTHSTASDTPSQRDPETLATGHRIFLASLAYAILLTDTPYAHNLRSLLRNVDNLVAFFHRLLDTQAALDLERQAGGESARTEEETRRFALELDRARKRVDSDLKMVVNRLRQLDRERIGSLRYLDWRGGGASDFTVWKGGGVDRLLMKLDFGRLPEEAHEIL